MLIGTARTLRASEITGEREYLTRRDFVRLSSAAAIGALGVAHADGGSRTSDRQEAPVLGHASPFSTGESLTNLEDVTGYNNFYEFGFDKEDPARLAGQLNTTPWAIQVEGHIHTPKREYYLEDILKPHPLEERVYRLRCVEGWSMVVPWLGFPLADLIKRLEPTSEARFVEFQTLYRPKEMPAQRVSQSLPSTLANRFRPAAMPGGIEWPYVEGLRMDEALHPLAFLAVGLYGKTLPNQNGAPIRLVVPWKYGFKSIKSIVRIRFVKNPPRTSWNVAFPHEFGFYANVNPQVDRPQSQKTERRIGKFFRQPTLMFNGYADQVGHLYAAMDLSKAY